MNGRQDPRVYRGANGPATGDVDDALRLLANPVRRAILYRLVGDPSNAATVDDVVETCVERTDVGREALRVELHHAHLPALRSTDLVDFDEQSGVLRYYRDPFVEQVLDVVHRWEE